MSIELHQIRTKIADIQLGLIRYRENDEQMSFQVKAVPDEDNVLLCIISGDISADEILNKKVNLIQRDKNDYIFLTGNVTAEVRGKVQVLAINIQKACWFERKTKGATRWLKEKYVYENYVTLQELELAS